MHLIKMKLPKSYLEKEYKLIRQDILFKNDMVHFPTDLQFVSPWKTNRDSYKRSLRSVEISRLYFSKLDFDTKYRIDKKVDEFDKLSKSLVGDGKDIEDVLKQLHQLSQDQEMVVHKKHSELLVVHTIHLDKLKTRKKYLTNSILNKKNNDSNDKKTPTMFCQETSCNGMLGENSICVSCDTSYCRDCNTRLDENHQCNLDDIQSFKLIKNQTKPCPKCFIPIYKIHGCDQMFCTSCYTPFSWNTGRVLSDTGFFHNPHYFQHLNNGGRNIFTNIEDEAPISWEDLSKKINEVDRVNKEKITVFYRKLLELIDINLNNFREEPGKRVERVKFLSNDITELQYKSYLTKEDKKKELLFNIDKVYELFYHQSFDALINFQDLESFRINIRKTFTECSTCIKTICKDFGSKSKNHNTVLEKCAFNIVIRII